MLRITLIEETNACPTTGEAVLPAVLRKNRKYPPVPSSTIITRAAIEPYSHIPLRGRCGGVGGPGMNGAAGDDCTEAPLPIDCPTGIAIVDGCSWVAAGVCGFEI